MKHIYLNTSEYYIPSNVSGLLAKIPCCCNLVFLIL